MVKKKTNKKGRPSPKQTSKSSKKTKSKKGSSKTVDRKKWLRLGVPTNRRERLVDLELTKGHDFLSNTKPVLTEIFPMVHEGGNRYAVLPKPAYVSTLMKLVAKVGQTNDLSETWSLILWDINQRDILPDGVSVTFVRSFERKDNESTKKEIGRRRKMAMLSSENEEAIQKQSAAVQHDRELMIAINTGDSVVSFGAEALITAPDDQVLEEAMGIIQDYLKTNDETRGLEYEIDINRQARPFVTYGPNKVPGNREVFYEMTSFDAAQSALFVDSGGDRTYGSEYVGVSIGKLIRSHAAYNFQNHRSLFVGNDTQNKTFTIGTTIDEPSQVYLSKVASRSYLLEGHSVTHIVADHADTVKHLMNFPLYDSRKVNVDVSKGLLNIIEPIHTEDLIEYPERIISRFPMHIDNIITLLSQFRSNTSLSTTDDFASMARDILIDFFVMNKYWKYGAENDLSDLRLFGIHNQYKILKDFGGYIAQRIRSNNIKELVAPLKELDTIINRNILPTIPALNTHTDEIIDNLVNVPYRVVDLTGMGMGRMANVDNPSMNVMMIAYLNVLLPALNNGDVVVIHGMSRMKGIADVVNNALQASGINVDVIFTESNQSSAQTFLELNDSEIDFSMVDLYENRVSKLAEPLGMDPEWSESLRQSNASFFVRSGSSMDYIYLDNIL